MESVMSFDFLINNKIMTILLGAAQDDLQEFVIDADKLFLPLEDELPSIDDPEADRVDDAIWITRKAASILITRADSVFVLVEIIQYDEDADNFTGRLSELALKNKNDLLALVVSNRFEKGKNDD